MDKDFNINKATEDMVAKTTDEMIEILAQNFTKNANIYSAHTATLIWKRMHQLTNQMHEIKKAAQTRDWGDE